MLNLRQSVCIVTFVRVSSLLLRGFGFKTCFGFQPPFYQILRTYFINPSATSHTFAALCSQWNSDAMTRAGEFRAFCSRTVPNSWRVAAPAMSDCDADRVSAECTLGTSGIVALNIVQASDVANAVVLPTSGFSCAAGADCGLSVHHGAQVCGASGCGQMAQQMA